MRCVQCGARAPRDAKFCTTCGQPLVRVSAYACSACGADLPVPAKFCVGCGGRAQMSTRTINAAAPRALTLSRREAARTNLYFICAAGVVLAVGIGGTAVHWKSPPEHVERAPAAIAPEPQRTAEPASPRAQTASYDSGASAASPHVEPVPGERDEAAPRPRSAPEQHSAMNPSYADQLLRAAIAGDDAKLQAVIKELKSRDAPRGDRRLARRLNEQGLALFADARYTEAASVFAEADRADNGDAEVKENFGYALLKSGEPAQAERTLVAALELAPERASAWGSLAHVYAKLGRHHEGVALIETAYRFAPAKRKTLGVYARQAEANDDPRVRAMLKEAVAQLSRAP